MREILEEVAAGTLSPEEALRRLDAGQADERRAPAPPPTPVAEEPLRKVRVVRHLGPVEITGDITVSEAVASGPHVAHREGDTLVVEAAESWKDEGAFTFGGMGGRMGWGLGGGGMHQDPITVRMNPTLALEVVVQAGLSHIRDVLGPIKADVQAGWTTISGFAGPVDLSVQAGAVRAEGRLDAGGSRIRCEAGSVTLRLTPESSVRVRVHSTFGRVNLPDGEGWALGATDRETVVGGGAGTLDIDTTMGSVSVAVGP